MMAPETVVTVDNNKPANAPPPNQGHTVDWLKIDVMYFRTQLGTLKIVQLILGILCMALGTPQYSTWFVFVAVSCFITTIVWSFVHFLSIKQALRVPINWVLSELISNAIQTFMYLLAFIVLFAATAQYHGYGYGSNVAAAVFGILNTAAYGASSFLLYKEHKSTTTAPAA